MPEKTCTKCGVVYKEPLEKWFHKNCTNKDKLSCQCKKCVAIYKARRYKKDVKYKANLYAANKRYKQTKKGKERQRVLNRKRTTETYGLTPMDYNRMWVKQKGCCAICGRHQDEFKRKLAIDHNHETGQVRGLLCTRCNTLVEGVADKNFMQSALEYLNNAE